MNSPQAIPSFDIQLAGLDRFILELVEAYKAGNMKSWDNLAVKVNAYFTPERMDYVEARAPGWQKMASYMKGVTLIHVMGVFLGLYMMPEYLSMTKEQQQMMKWVVLLHDVEKEPQKEKRDHLHAFRSAIAAARILPRLGFPTTPEYDLLLDDWSSYTRSAITKQEDSPDQVQDNLKLPEILDGIGRMFGRSTPPALIIKTILLHLSIDMQPWPPITPLTDEEVRMYVDHDLVPLLRAVNLGDGEGWNMFDEDRESLRNSTLEAFKKVERLISG
ncbi:MAG TPA: hypothetical protein VI524_14070 [Anaerolineales bacterium]|nr:hypothetical protein [Anaerolineales bacterium]